MKSSITSGCLPLGEDTRPASDWDALGYKTSRYITFPRESVVNNIYNIILSQFDKARFITLRPHDQYIGGLFERYNQNDIKEEYRLVFNNIINCPFIGSCEKNNKIFVHFHLILFPKNKKHFNDIIIKLKSKFSIEYNMNHKAKVPAIQESTLDNADNIKRFILYYLGIKNQSFKDSFLQHIFNFLSIPPKVDNELLIFREEFVITKYNTSRQKKEKKKEYNVEGYIHETSTAEISTEKTLGKFSIL